MELATGTYDATVESVYEEDGTLILNMKVSDKSYDGKSMLIGSIQIPFYIDMYEKMVEPYIPQEPSWQSMNKGGFSKKERRGKL